MSYLTSREEEIFRLLEVIRAGNIDYVVIGGYAVDAYTIHRYSVDLDVFVPRQSLRAIGELLEAEGYTVKGRSRQMLEYVRRIFDHDVSAELFTDNLTCRQTEGVWSYDLTRKNAISRRIVGMMGSTQSLVPRKELLIAMKLHSCRAPDLRDVVMLSEDVDWESVARFADTGVKEKVLGQLDTAAKAISQTKFASDLHSEFSVDANVLLPVKRTTAGIMHVKNYLSNAKT